MSFKVLGRWAAAKPSAASLDAQTLEIKRDYLTGKKLIDGLLRPARLGNEEANMKLWTIKEIAELGIYSLSFIKKAIYKQKTLKVHRLGGSTRVKHSDLVEWLGIDPLKPPAGGSIEITKTVQTKDKTITTTTRIQ